MTDIPSSIELNSAISNLGINPDKALEAISLLNDAEVEELYTLVSQIAEKDKLEAAADDLVSFCQYMDDTYLVGTHHRHLAALLMDIESREKDRITVSIAPRHGKSRMVSELYAAWYMGRNPTHKVMLVSHTSDLAVDFGRKIRDIIKTPQFQQVFPGVSLAIDSKSAGRWNTNQGGVFYAAGVGGALAGRGADLLIIDDPHSEQDVLAGNFEVFEKAYQWYTFGARTRLMPNAVVAIVATRWHQSDLIGRVLQDMRKDEKADQWHVVEFPALVEVPDKRPEADIGATTIKALWPEFFDVSALERTKASMPVFQWNAQYMQSPTSEEAAIVKREDWNIWVHDDPPPVDFIIMSLDSAAETHNRADFTSLTTWGVFTHDNDNGERTNNIMLLNAIRERYEFPELKAKVLAEYKEWNPDSFMVEKKSSGVAIYQELRRLGIPVQEFTPHRGTGDKVARLNSVTDIVSSGLCWAPRTRWAEELIDEVAAFPFGQYDDQVDSTVMALMRFRKGGFITLPDDDAAWVKPEPRYRGGGRSRFY